MSAMRQLRLVGATLLSFTFAFAAAPTAWAVPHPGLAVPPPNWGGCGQWLGDTSIAPAARCATIAVPIDYSRPDGPQAQLAVIRVPATGSRLGVLLINPGGPGASAVDSVATAVAGLGNTPVGEHFDLIGVDPRGVGHSTPAVRCRTDSEFDAWRREPMADYSQAGVAHIEQLYQQFAGRCAQRMGTDFLANAGTATTAKDMDVVRQALGETQINYLGYSYGTQLGAAYADAFPQNVRTMVLDGAVDPSLDPVEEQVRQMASFQLAFNDYAADCAKVEGCPLGNDPAKAVDRYHALVDPLVNTPGHTSDPRGLSYQDAVTGTINALYTQRYWKFLTSGLLGLERGTDAGDLLMLADDYQGRNDAGHYNNLQDAFTAIRCVDNVSPTDPGAWAAADQRIRQLAPFLSYGEFTGFAPRDVCSFWPVPPTSRPHDAVSPGPGKVVVVSTTHDPATPYEAGVALARQLGASLITNDGTQHTVVFTGNECVDSAVTT
ncbi:MAG: alpha/beta hydrolase, partial [Mycobacteriaceae bacterium]|nr:alpha/beta hydrolase [Mycobacteriaceae bacterium]